MLGTEQDGARANAGWCYQRGQKRDLGLLGRSLWPSGCVSSPSSWCICGLDSLTKNKALRFIYGDENTHFLQSWTCECSRLQVSQAHHDANPDFKWIRGAAMTAALEILCDAVLPVSNEDVRHEQSCVIQF